MGIRKTAIAVGVAALLALSVSSTLPASARSAGAGLTTHQRSVLRAIAQDTWRFFQKDVDPNTHLPLDNIGPGATRGDYTSSANIGVYLWSVVAARDLGLISTGQATARALATMGEVQHLQRGFGFLYQWYDTNNGGVIMNPGQGPCP